MSIILLYIQACKTDYRFSNIYQKSSLKRTICSQCKDKLLCSFPYMYRVGYFTCTIIRQFYLSLMIWSCSDETVELSTFGSSPVGFVVSSSNRQAKKWRTGSRSCWPGSQLWWWCHGHASLYAGNGPGKHPQVLKTHYNTIKLCKSNQVVQSWFWIIPIFLWHLDTETPIAFFCIEKAQDLLE